jgi:hypothetical protein
MSDLPSGIVTFLFTDIQAATARIVDPRVRCATGDARALSASSASVDVVAASP